MLTAFAAPVQHLARYENRIAFPKDDFSLTGWNGPPTPETNESWFSIAERMHFLFFPTSICQDINFKLTGKLMVLPREDLERAGEDLTTAVELKTGGYLATFAVFHDLHCLVSDRLPVRTARKGKAESETKIPMLKRLNALGEDQVVRLPLALLSGLDTGTRRGDDRAPWYVHVS